MKSSSPYPFANHASCADWSPDDIAAAPLAFRTKRAVELFQDGRSIDSIAMTLNIGISHTRKIIRDSGIIMREETPATPLRTEPVPINIHQPSSSPVDVDTQLNANAKKANATFVARLLRYHIKRDERPAALSIAAFRAVCTRYHVALPAEIA